MTAASSHAAIGVLLTNVGSPAAPTPAALRRYLHQFLRDQRIVELPPLLWQPLLWTTVLPSRPRRISRLYRNIWQGNEAPLVAMSRRQASGLAERLNARYGCRGEKSPLSEGHSLRDLSVAERGRQSPAREIRVEIGMRYGAPSIADGLRALQAAGAERILILPLFPQYSATTTASSMDAVFAELRHWRRIPELRTIAQYGTHPVYIEALAEDVRQTWRERGQPERLLISFHGIPRPYIDRGDPYQQQCLATAHLLAQKLELQPSAWSIGFQSRLGPVEWLSPYSDEVLRAWGEARIRSVQVICPGFSVDCLETTDEIGREGKHQFQEAGGGDFHYIPALNASTRHLDALTTIVAEHLTGWPLPSPAGGAESDPSDQGELAAS